MPGLVVLVYKPGLQGSSYLTPHYYFLLEQHMKDVVYQQQSHTRKTTAAGAVCGPHHGK